MFHAAAAVADRAYRPDGRLVPRTEAGAVRHDASEVARRVLRLAEEGVLTTEVAHAFPAEEFAAAYQASGRTVITF